MNVKLLGAASLAAMALVACTKKEAEAPAAEAPVAVETEPAVEAVEPVVEAETTDVYAAPTSFDLGALRTRDALTAATDSVFAKADADANGSLSNVEFYSLAALVQPTVEAVETTVDSAVEMVTDAGANAAGAMVGEVAGEKAGDAAAATVDGALGTEPAATDNAALDASFKTLSGDDASLSLDEVRNAFLASFNAADVNADGSLDDAEVIAFKTAKLF
jgi:hypothetical protein